MKKIIVILFIFLLVAPQQKANAETVFDTNAAKTYLLSHSQNPWAALGLAALGENNFQKNFLKSINGSSAIDFEAPILAITALGENPRTFATEDLIKKLKSFHQHNQLGDPNTVNDDIFGILALVSSGESPSDPVVQDSKNFVLASQKQNGGWGFALSAESDTNTTAAAIVALKSLGVTTSDPKIQSALQFLKTAQNPDGGFTYDPNSSYGTQSDSSSTAWVLWALNSINTDENIWSKDGHSPSEYLISLQTSGGYFEYQSGAGENSLSSANTAYSAIALLGKFLPLKISTSAFQQTFSFRIEGSNETVCEGRAAGPTALDLVKNASAVCGFTYHIKDTSFGPYLDQIESDVASGTLGWQYSVNWTIPQIGAADYVLKSGDEVLWYFGNFDAKPLLLDLSKTEIASGQNVLATVKDLEGQSVAGASVYAGTLTYSTNASGQSQISAPDGYYKIFAQKDGYVRSNKILLKIGSPSQGNINLSANITEGSVYGTSTGDSTLSFTVNPENLDFGSLKAGQNAEKNITITNTGSVAINFEAITSGDSLFVDNLKIDNGLWKNFKTDLAPGHNKEKTIALTVPSAYQLTGQKQGSLIIWASPR